MTHKERLKIAQKLAQEVLKKCRDSVMAVAVYSLTAKGEDSEHSDLEILAVTTNELPVEDELFFYRVSLCISIAVQRKKRSLRPEERVYRAALELWSTCRDSS